VDLEHQEEQTMSPERYAGAAGELQRREDEQRNSGAARVDADDARRDLQARLPYGRALDLEDLVSMCDEGSQTNRAIVLRQRLLAEHRKNLPTGILLERTEVEQLRADSIEHPTRPGPCPKLAEWPPAK
jgi:hypothetical protein